MDTTISNSAPAASCPRCGQAVDPQARNCGHCGIDLALAVVLAERALATSMPTPSGTPISSTPIAPEILVPRLGDYLIEKGVLQPEELQRALDYQREKSRQGEPLLVGQSLLELGLVEQETLDEAITEQILQLQAALQQSNRQLEQRVKERTVDLQNALNKLSELNQLKSNFISNISHELRTPLTHIKGYLDLLADGSLGSLNEAQTDAMGVLLRAESRLEQLIDDLIYFSLASRGEFSLDISPTTIGNLLEKPVNKAYRTAATKRVSLITKVQPEVLALMVKVDVEKVSWVLMQLLDNAIKFTTDGGRVTLEAANEGNILLLRVSDTGIGIPGERLSEIFEPFHQLDGSETRRYGGTGLGLALVRRIVEGHGSRIKVESEVGVGSTFEFFLPILDQQADGPQNE